MEGKAARRCGRQRHLDAQRWAPAPAQSIGSLSPPPRLGCRQVHFRATGQIDSSAFIFFRLRSGSCLETGGRSTENGERQTQERGREGKRRSAMKEGRRREKEELLALFLIHVFSCSSLFSLSPSPGSTANTPPPTPNRYQDMHSLHHHQVPSWKLAQGQACRFTTGSANGFLLLF